MKIAIKSKTKNAIYSGLSVAGLLTFLWSYSETGAPPRLISTQNESNDPDVYLINPKSRKYDQQGRLELTLDSNSAQHYPMDKVIKLSKPNMVFFNDDGSSWLVSANSGVATDNNKQLDLFQQVVIVSNDQLTHLRTPALTLYPDRKLAKTDQPATLVNPTGFTRTIGFIVDMRKEKITLLSDVRGQYEVKP